MKGIVQTVIVSGSLDRMERGESGVFSLEPCVNTVRNTCVRLRHATGKAWTVDKGKDGYTVTRTV